MSPAHVLPMSPVYTGGRAPVITTASEAVLAFIFGGPFANPPLRRVGLGHLAGGDSPRGSPWNGCGWPPSKRLMAWWTTPYTICLTVRTEAQSLRQSLGSFVGLQVETEGG